LINRINKSGAGVTANYDSSNDRFTILNTTPAMSAWDE